MRILIFSIIGKECLSRSQETLLRRMYFTKTKDLTFNEFILTQSFNGSIKNTQVNKEELTS